MRRYFLAALCAAIALSACEGQRNNSSWSHRKDGAAVVPPLTKTTAGDSTAAKSDSTKTESAPADTTQHEH